jgi:hypothetical protein
MQVVAVRRAMLREERPATLVVVIAQETPVGAPRAQMVQLGGGWSRMWKPARPAKMPMDMEAARAKVEARPIKMEARPIKMEARPIKMEAMPIKVEVTKEETDAAPILEVTRGTMAPMTWKVARIGMLLVPRQGVASRKWTARPSSWKTR